MRGKLGIALLLAAGSAAGSVALVAQARTPTALARSVPYESCFKQSAAKYNLSAVLLQAVAATESNFNPNAISPANAHGLMQIQWPGTAKHLGVRRVGQLYQPCKNIDLGARYLRELLDRYEGDERRALAAYNYGPGRIGQQGSIPDGAQGYVNRVRGHRLRLLGGGAKQPQPTLKVKTRKSGKTNKNQLVAKFSSRSRANRYARMLGKKVPSATFQVQRASEGPHAVLLTSGADGLSADDRIVLTSLGWRPAP